MVVTWNLSNGVRSTGRTSRDVPIAIAVHMQSSASKNVPGMVLLLSLFIQVHYNINFFKCKYVYIKNFPYFIVILKKNGLNPCESHKLDR